MPDVLGTSIAYTTEMNHFWYGIFLIGSLLFLAGCTRGKSEALFVSPSPLASPISSPEASPSVSAQSQSGSFRLDVQKIE